MNVMRVWGNNSADVTALLLASISAARVVYIVSLFVTIHDTSTNVLFVSGTLFYNIDFREMNAHHVAVCVLSVIYCFAKR